MKKYSMEFRIEVAAAYDSCGSSIEVAEEKGCSESWVRRLIQQRRTTGSLSPKTPDRSGTRRLDEEDLKQLRKLIDRKPDMTLGELAEALNHKASVPTIWRAAEAMELTLKKRPRTPPSRIGPTSKKNATIGLRSSRR
jgi:transposase